jgi:hypothetical protein
VAKARQLAGIPASSHVGLVLYPAKKSLWELIMETAGGDEASVADTVFSKAGFGPLGEALRDSSLRVWMHGGMLRMTPFSFGFR